MLGCFHTSDTPWGKGLRLIVRSAWAGALIKHVVIEARESQGDGEIREPFNVAILSLQGVSPALVIV